MGSAVTIWTSIQKYPIAISAVNIVTVFVVYVSLSR
jgi:hypothetical protein